MEGFANGGRFELEGNDESIQIRNVKWRVYVDSTVIVKELDVSDVVTLVIGSNTACQIISVLPFV